MYIPEATRVIKIIKDSSSKYVLYTHITHPPLNLMRHSFLTWSYVSMFEALVYSCWLKTVLYSDSGFSALYV
jgi:hypothetical protein